MRFFTNIKTTKGTVRVRLDAKAAAVNVNNFVFLADQHFYKCNVFHRVIPGFMDQTGDPTATGAGGPGYVVPSNEFPKAAAKFKNDYPSGTVAMANSCPPADTPAQCPKTNGSQFFIMASNDNPLPAKYTIIGKVVAGMGAVLAINSQGNANPNANGVPPLVTNRVVSISISTT